MTNRLPWILAAVLLAVVGCDKKSPAEPEARSVPATPTSARVTAPAAAATPAPGIATAAIGRPAPAFTLKDLDGHDVSLASFRGKTVVLEWFNPGCPFVNLAHTKGSLKEMAKRTTSSGVVWLAINSGGAGKQGAGVEANRDGKKKFGLDHPVLLDETGAVGHAYGATNTPHMFVVDAEGTLVYRGAIDDTAGGEPEANEKVVNYVDDALASLRANKPVAKAETKAFGCSVKYAN
ncbi:MAG: redoxin family protein [Polyangiaceae bacterium]